GADPVPRRHLPAEQQVAERTDSYLSLMSRERNIHRTYHTYHVCFCYDRFMTEFVNRRSELTALSEWWERDTRPALIWGRRRVGKSALMERFSELTGARVLWHTGAGRPGAGELQMLSRRAAAITRTGIRAPATVPYRDWDEALEHIASQAEDEPLLLVLDE